MNRVFGKCGNKETKNREAQMFYSEDIIEQVRSENNIVDSNR